MSGHELADEDLLTTALSSSFTKLPPSEVQAPTPAAAAEPTPEPAAAAPTAEASTSAADDSWKSDYDRQLAAWRAESAVAREKAERTRAEWEERRKAEEADAAARSAEQAKNAPKQQATRESSIAGWESVHEGDDSASTSSQPAPKAGGVPTTDEKASARRIGAAQAAVHKHEETFGREATTPEPSPADARDLTSNERQHVAGSSGLNFPVSSPATSRPLQFDSDPPTSDDEQRISHAWEEVPSMASSFPSLPDIVTPPKGSASIAPTSPSTKVGQFEKAAEDAVHHHHHHHHHEHEGEGKERVKTNPGPPPSLTLSIFAAGLSPRARALAVVSSIGINFLLPFVNGVMLGFGEIFARTFVAPLFGIYLPGVPKGAAAVSGVGIRSGSRR